MCIEDIGISLRTYTRITTATLNNNESRIFARDLSRIGFLVSALTANGQLQIQDTDGNWRRFVDIAPGTYPPGAQLNYKDHPGLIHDSLRVMSTGAGMIMVVVELVMRPVLYQEVKYHIGKGREATPT